MSNPDSSAGTISHGGLDDSEAFCDLPGGGGGSRGGAKHKSALKYVCCENPTHHVESRAVGRLQALAREKPFSQAVKVWAVFRC